MQKNSGQGAGGWLFPGQLNCLESGYGLLFLAQKDGFMKAILKMSNQEFGHVPALIERTARLLVLESSRTFLSEFSAHSTFSHKKV